MASIVYRLENEESTYTCPDCYQHEREGHSDCTQGGSAVLREYQLQTNYIGEMRRFITSHCPRCGRTDTVSESAFSEKVLSELNALPMDILAKVLEPFPNHPIRSKFPGVTEYLRVLNSPSSASPTPKPRPKPPALPSKAKSACIRDAWLWYGAAAFVLLIAVLGPNDPGGQLVKAALGLLGALLGLRGFANQRWARLGGLRPSLQSPASPSPKTRARSSIASQTGTNRERE